MTALLGLLIVLPLLADEPVQQDLEQIEQFSVQMNGEWLAGESSNDEAVALLVNPFNVRKRGKYYGSVYEYHRNDNFDARNFFDPVGEPLPEFKRNQFGFSIGGLISPRLKVFGSYDGLRIIKGSTIVSMVPTPAMKMGDFSATGQRQLIDPFTGEPFEDNRIPQDRIHPVSAKLLSLFPDPTRDDPMRNYANNHPVVNNNNSISSRLDYEISPQTKIFGNYSMNYGNQELVSSLPAFGTTMDEKNQDLSINLTHSFNSNRILNLQANFERTTSLQLSQHAFREGLVSSLGIEGIAALDPMDEGYPQFDIMGYANLGFGFGGFFAEGFAAGSPENFCENEYGFSGNYTYVRGSHTIVAGGELQLTQLNNMRTGGSRRGEFGFSGFFTGDAFADFLLGIPYTAKRGIGSDRSDLRQRTWRVYVKDDWKINSNLTLSAEIAYRYSPFYSSPRNRVSFFYPLRTDPPLDGEFVVTGGSRARAMGLDLAPGQAAYPDTNDWQPSFGIAYSPLGNNRLVLRASYRIQHGFMNPIQGLIYIGRNYPFFYLEKAESPTIPSLDLSNPFASTTPAALTLQAADPHLRNPFMQLWNASLDYELWRSWTVQLSYRGEKTSRMFRAVPANVPKPAPFGTPIQPRRPNPSYGQFDILTSGGSFSGNTLDVQVRRRLTGAFSLQGGFVWMKGISDVWGWAFVNPNNPDNLAAERSLWGFGPPMRFNLNYILDLPVGRGKLLSTGWAGKLNAILEGWKISGITTIMSGFPFNPEIFGDPNNDGVWGDRPNRIGPGTLPRSQRSIDQWFDTSAFVMPDYGANQQWYGNAGRNILLTPGTTNWDISLLKSTRVSGDGNMLEFRVQFFNAFNHVNFQQPGSFWGTPTFGVISNADNAREIEIAVKYSF